MNAHAQPSRRRVFLYQDGLVLGCTMRALDQTGVLARLWERDAWTLGELAAVTRTRPSYLQVALRCLASQGWLEQSGRSGHPQLRYGWRSDGRGAEKWFDVLIRGGEYLCTDGARLALAPGSETAPPSKALEELVAHALTRWSVGDRMPSPVLQSQLDGMVLVPAFLALGRSAGGEASPGPAARFPVVNGHPFPLPAVQPVLRMQRFLDPTTGQWTEEGQHMATYVPNLGMAASYLPLLARLPALMNTGDPAPIEQTDDGVDRALNVIGSGWAHRRYFEDADAIFQEVFDREPLDEQPRFVADVGCGDGTWLERIYRTVERSSLRGRHLDTHPLILVGIDLSPAARALTARRLDAAGIPRVILPGDIRDPAGIARELAEHGLTMRDGLQVRSFLDHDRPFGSAPVRDLAGTPVGAGVRTLSSGSSTGAFIDARGGMISCEHIEADLVQHLRAWTPYLAKHGLVLLEAHCVAPAVARRHVGEAYIAYDAYHGYSRQYPVEYQVFMRACQRAGLVATPHQQHRYPSRRPFVAVSLSRLVVPTPTTSYRAAPFQVRRDRSSETSQCSPAVGCDVADGEALHRLLYHDGDVGNPRRWCGLPTGQLVRHILHELGRKLAALPEEASDRTLRILDYGTGTGHSILELLKAFRASGFWDALERRRARVEILASDVPGNWFARGTELLRDVDCVSFHALTRNGRFLPLLEVTGGRTVDVVVASMVFHLVPPRALSTLAQQLASVSKPDGVLLWSSPDIGPAPRDAVCFHDPSRALRSEVLRILDGNLAALGHLIGPSDQPDEYAWLPEALAAFLADSEPGSRPTRRPSQVLPEPTSVRTLEAAFAGHFAGPTRHSAFELLARDIQDMLLVPSNQGNYFPELPDPELREALLRVVLRGSVLPAFLAGPAGTGPGCSVWWSFGCYRKVPG